MKLTKPRSIAAALALLSVSFRTASAACTKRSLPCSVDTFKDAILLPGVAVTVLKADHVLKGGSYGDPLNKGFPNPIDKLPELCAVTVSVTNITDVPDKPISEYQVGLYLPARWKGRMLTVGSGSFAGGINWVGMSEGPHYGFATVATDNGHNSNGSDTTWANEKTLYDWGYRAVHGAVVVGKLLTQHYYRNKPVVYSYYSGCSTGGRQGLREIQYDADSFDGALIGAPAWDTVRLMPWVSKIAHGQLSGDPADLLGPQQFAILAAEVLRQCDGQDGHVDGVVSTPEACVFDIDRIVCADPTRCVTAGQARAAQRVWADYEVDGRLVSHGFGLTSEDQWAAYFADVATMSGFDFDFERTMVYNDSSYTFRNFSDAVVADTIRVNPGQATADRFDIRAFRDRAGPRGGGKVLMYHGLADGLISPRSSLQYYEATAAATGDDAAGLRRWFRYFEVPGMQHCFFTGRYNAPWHFGGAAQAAQLRMLPYILPGAVALGDGWSVPGHLGDPAYDAYAALVRWVEEEQAPEQIVATAFNVDFTVNRTRPLCPYPGKAVYGAGDINDAASWHCEG